ncbi:MAG: hypothetical protein F6K14_08300 [Symploca sp. SIO2C1]|nr:hypothetical protein [Symploca sp. SIO2C1]
MKVSELAQKMGLRVKDTLEILAKAGLTAKNGSSEIPSSLGESLLATHQQVSESVGLPPQLPSTKEVKSGDAELPKPEEVGILAIAEAQTISEMNNASMDVVYTMVDRIKSRYEQVLVKTGIQQAERDETFVNQGRAVYHLKAQAERLRRLEEANKQLDAQSVNSVLANMGIDLNALVDQAQSALDDYNAAEQRRIDSANHFLQTGELLKDENGEVIPGDFFTLYNARISA